MKPFLRFVLLSIGSSCAPVVLQGSPADIHPTGNLSFDEVSLMNTSVRSLTLRNVGETEARSVAIEGLAGEFLYSGGSAPGTGGNCGSEVEAGETCTIVLAYSPTTGVSHSQTAYLSYQNGRETVRIALDLSGTAVPQGTLDTSFGTMGIQQLDWGDDERIVKLISRSDDKIVIVGHADSGATGDGNVVLARLNSDGSLDSAFGTSGRVNFDSGGNAADTPYAAVLTSTGQILVAGQSDDQSFVARFNSDGSPDASFGFLNGVSVLPQLILTQGEATYGVLVQANGRILIGGETNPLLGPPLFPSSGFVRRLGVLDTLPDLTYGVLGSRGVDFVASQDSRIQAMEFAPGESLIAAGYTATTASRDSAIAKLNPTTGALDTTFDGDGLKAIDACGNGRDDEILALAVTSSPAVKIFAAGYCSTVANGRNLFVIKLNEDGTLDTSFAGTGTYMKDISALDDTGATIAVGSNGKVLVGGSTRNAGRDRFLLIRLNANGTEDPVFGTSGIQTATLGTGDARATTMTIQSNGKILLGGFSTNTGSDFAIIRYFP